MPSRVQEVAGVAWWAHAGGFLFGASLGHDPEVRGPAEKSTSSRVSAGLDSKSVATCQQNVTDP